MISRIQSKESYKNTGDLSDWFCGWDVLWILSESASVLEFIYTLVLLLSLSLDPQAILLQTCIQTLAHQK
jgi:hypothetical protein